MTGLARDGRTELLAKKQAQKRQILQQLPYTLMVNLREIVEKQEPLFCSLLPTGSY